MGIFNRLRDVLTEPSIDDVEFYSEISREIDSGFRRDGIWAKAMSEAGFDDAKARSLYMKMAVKALIKEKQDDINQAAINKNNSINQALKLFDEKRYDESIDGLLIRVNEMKDPVAATCLAWIYWHGVSKKGINKTYANALFDWAAQSTNPEHRRYLGAVLESIDWKRALMNLDYAASNNNADAKVRLIDLRSQLKKQGLIPKNLIERIFN